MALLRKQLSFSSSSFKSSRTTNIHYPINSSHPPGTISEFVWKDYSPVLFRNIQELGDVNYDDYMISVCNHENLLELTVRGSGKPFHVSHDDRFVIKTLRKSEAKVLLEMLPSFYDHIQKYGNSLLAKYYGLHATRPGSGGTKIYFVVMENLLRTEMQIHKRYDLKGSSQGRSATKNGTQPILALKDPEFDFCFYLDSSTQSQILEQIKLDCKYLEEQGIMDYSLLLGIHVEQTRRDSAKGRPCHDPSQVQNGMDRTQSEIVEPYHSRDPTFSHFFTAAAATEDNRRNVTRFGAKIQARAVKVPQCEPKESNHSSSKLQDSKNVYLFLGIIDFLQDYNVMKRLEHAYKSLQYDSKTISSVNPNFYAARFQDFLSKVFLVEESSSLQSERLVIQKATSWQS
ncbi:phosphatidylinositol 4-phosphate 5-kinase 10-like [Chenopodium quinoa]|uniref:1-phosphatidylinositol-4-phosphate 5-kinase n=1 Tax=Chenopodium quinoa TaxID=63459 RepID=A0A803M341_CHEQI|nr:phosphatidylinositol 4-phosphate 5-kinase 10-like [Chenopodium quinoa]